MKKDWYTIVEHKGNYGGLKNSRFYGIERFLELGLLEKFKVILGGGACRTLTHGGRNEDVKDYDVFFKDLDEVAKVREYLEKDCRGQLIFQCPEGKLYTYIVGEEGFVDVDQYVAGMKIQLITERSYSNPISLIDGFDVYPCVAALEYVDDKYAFSFHRKFIKGIQTRILELHNVTYYASTIGRIGKYRAKGMKIGGACEDLVRRIADEAVLNAHDGNFWTGDRMRWYID